MAFFPDRRAADASHHEPALRAGRLPSPNEIPEPAMPNRKLTLEGFESRIVPSATVKFTEVDGDKITVKTSKGTTAQLEQALGLPNGATDVDFIGLNFLASAGVAAAFAGTNVTISAGGAGDRLANNVTVNAFDNSGSRNIDLGTIAIKGNLLYIDAGDENLVSLAIKKLTVTSWGPADSFDTAISSQIRGNIGAIVVQWSFNGYLYSNAADGSANFRTDEGTVIGSFQAGSFAEHYGDQNGYLQVHGINRLKITGAMFGPSTLGTTNNGLIEAVYVDKVSINTMLLGAEINLFSSV
jgi:hypothetical protein